MDSVSETLSTIKKVRFLLPDAEDDMNDLEATIEQLASVYQENLQDISNINRLLSEKVKGLSDELQEANRRMNEMEKHILLYNQHHPCGLINRRYFDYYMMSSVNRPATDKEWGRFIKEFIFNTDKVNAAIYKWIEKVTGVPQLS